MEEENEKVTQSGRYLHWRQLDFKLPGHSESTLQPGINLLVKEEPCSRNN